MARRLTRGELRKRRDAMAERLRAELEDEANMPRAGEVVSLGPIADAIQRELSKEERKQAKRAAFVQNGETT